MLEQLVICLTQARKIIKSLKQNSAFRRQAQGW